MYEADHLGPLEGDDLAELADAVSTFRTNHERALRKFVPRDNSSQELLEQALELLKVEMGRAAEIAVQTGSYVAVAQGQPFSTSMPGGEVLATGASRGGKPVHIAILMPHATFPALANARRYYDDMRFFDDSEKARAFNALTYDERKRLVDDIQRARAEGPLNDEQMSESMRVFGFRSEVDPHTLLLRALPAR